MSKYQRVIRAEIPSPNAVDNKSGQILDGRMLVIGSVGADKISVRELSDLIKAMGTLTTGTIHLGEANRSYIRLTAADGNPPRFEVRDPQGRYVVVFDANPTDGVTAALGVPDANGVHPLRIPADTGAVEIRTRAIVGMNETARTFLDAGRIDLLASGTASWDDADATGIRLEAGWGIASKEAGVQSVKWDAETGKLLVGEWGQVQLQRHGTVYDADAHPDSGYTGAYWISENKEGLFMEGDAPSNTFAYVYTDRSVGALAYTRMAIGVWALNATAPAGELHLRARGHDLSEAVISLRAGDGGRTPGIYMTPPSDWSVHVESSMEVQGILWPLAVDMNALSGQFLPRRFAYMPLYSEMGEGEFAVKDSGAGSTVVLLYRQPGATELCQWPMEEVSP